MKTLVGLAVVLAALLTGPANASAAPTGSVSMRPTTELDPGPHVCGVHNHSIKGKLYRYYGNCSYYNHELKLDMVLMPDKTVCVPGKEDQMLGTTGTVRGVTYLGTC